MPISQDSRIPQATGSPLPSRSGSLDRLYLYHTHKRPSSPCKSYMAMRQTSESTRDGLTKVASMSSLLGVSGTPPSALQAAHSGEWCNRRLYAAFVARGTWAVALCRDSTTRPTGHSYSCLDRTRRRGHWRPARAMRTERCVERHRESGVLVRLASVKRKRK